MNRYIILLAIFIIADQSFGKVEFTVDGEGNPVFVDSETRKPVDPKAFEGRNDVQAALARVKAAEKQAASAQAQAEKLQRELERAAGDLDTGYQREVRRFTSLPTEDPEGGDVAFLAYLKYTSEGPGDPAEMPPLNDPEGRARYLKRVAAENELISYRAIEFGDQDLQNGMELDEGQKAELRQEAFEKFGEQLKAELESAKVVKPVQEQITSLTTITTTEGETKFTYDARTQYFIRANPIIPVKDAPATEQAPEGE